MNQSLRCEVKLVVAAGDHARVMAQLRLLPAVLRPEYPARTVQCIWFDTHDGRALQDSLAGVSERQKLRFRWYGEGADDVRGQLEWKRRVNSFGDKQVFVLPDPVAVRGSTRRALWRALRAASPAPWPQRLHGLEPAQWVRYHREYLVDPGGVRVTVDRDLRAFDQRFAFRLSDRRRTPLPEILIVEIKAPLANQATIERWLQRVDLRPGKCSKFVLASRPDELPVAQRYE